MVKVGRIPHPLFLGAKQQLASLQPGWRDVLGTDKAFAVLNPAAFHCQGPLCHLSDAFRRGCSISEPWGSSEGDKVTLEDSSQRGAQAGSSTGRVRGIFGLPGHAEEESGDGGLFSPRLDEMVTAGAGTCLCLASQVFKHTAVTYRRGDRDQIPPAAPKIPRAPAHHPLPPIEPWRAQDPQEWAVSGCTTLHPGGHYTASSMVPSCREQHPQDPKSCNSLSFTYPEPRSRPLRRAPGCRGTPWPKCPPAAETLCLQKVRLKPEFGPNLA